MGNGSSSTPNTNDHDNNNNSNNHNNNININKNEKQLSASNMYRKDTKTAWTNEQLLQYQLELQKEIKRQNEINHQKNDPPFDDQKEQIIIENASNINNNIFTCCFNTSKQKRRIHQNPIEDEQEEEEQQEQPSQSHPPSQPPSQTQTQTQTPAQEQPEEKPTIPIVELLDDGHHNNEDEDIEMSIDDRLVKIEPVIVEKKEDDLNLAVIDTTNAFLELLQLDTMSKHLQEMRDRKMFLEKAKNDKDLPEEERQIAAWITNTYLSKSPTTNIYPQAILENIIKKQNHHDDDKKDGDDNQEKQETDHKDKEDKEDKNDENNNKEIRILTELELRDLTKSIDLNENVLSSFSSSSVDKIIHLLSTINEWNFSVFEFVELCNDFSLSLLMITICKTRDMLSILNIPLFNLINYMNLIDLNYKNNPYHNSIHAADVLLNMYYFMKSSVFLHNISILDCFSILISASIHDVGHPGHGNSFEIATESELAIIYNDQSVLENMHISLAWKSLKAKDCNFLINMNKTEKRRFRKVLIDSVLATDMSQHSLHSETLENLVEKYENNKNNIDDIDKFSNQFLPIALHTADLGNLCKETKYYNEWVDRLMNEFFNQGDKERELNIEPISFLCDRFKVNIHSGQVGFINYVIRPWFSKFGRLLTEDSHNKLFLNLLNENLLYMQERANQTKDAQEEIKKNEDKLLIVDNDTDHDDADDNDNNHELDVDVDHEEEENLDKVQPLPSTTINIDNNSNQPIIYSIGETSRTSTKYSIVAMSFPEMRSKLLEYNDKEKENQ